LVYKCPVRNFLGAKLLGNHGFESAFDRISGKIISAGRLTMPKQCLGLVDPKLR